MANHRLVNFTCRAAAAVCLLVFSLDGFQTNGKNVHTQAVQSAQRRRISAQLEQLLEPAPHIELALSSASGAETMLSVREGRIQTVAPLNGQTRPVSGPGVRPTAKALQVSQRVQAGSL